MPENFDYIRSSNSRTLSIGMTNNLERRVWRHKQRSGDSFTARYNITMLVYFESYPAPRTAI